MSESAVTGSAARAPTDAEGGQADPLRALATLLLEEETLETTLARVIEVAVRSLPAFRDAAVTLVDGRGHRTATCTNEETLRIDQAQYDAGEGPCLEAIETGDVVVTGVSEALQRWPAFARAATAAGVTAFVGAPLVVGETVLGALNLYGVTDGPVPDVDRATLVLLREQASVALRNAIHYAAARRLVDQLTEALGSRAVIDQAKGVLMAQEGIDADTAFDRLRDRSQRENRKLRDIAAEVVASAESGRFMH